jgi:glycosyltransferase involved in cell wall biosynthesis
MKVVASLTTTPSRIDRIKVCLESLLTQTHPVDHIEINIPEKCLRTGEDYAIPEWLSTMAGLQIFRTPDYGSITKVVPTFVRYSGNTETFIWSVDDDWKYPNYTLEKLMIEHDASNPRILAHSGIKIDKNLKSTCLTGGSCDVDVAEGYTSILYPPSIWKNDIEVYTKLIAMSSDCTKSDGLILGNYFAKHKVVTFLTAFTTQKPLFSYLDKDLIQPYESDKDALHLQDGGHLHRFVKIMRWLKEKNLFYLPYEINSDVKIGLCMIVKDESHIIHESLNATLPLIDTYSIVDTGSSDNTIQIIKDFYEKNGIPGTVHQLPWKGFGTSRSEALKTCDGHMDYIIMIDADDLMGFPDGTKDFLKRTLREHNPNACNIQIRRGVDNTLEYSRTQIFKANDGWRYVGVLHEYPMNDSTNNKIIKLPTQIYMIGRTMGNRSLVHNGAEKYAQDAEVLLKALETEPNNDRYVFYLAQSYRDAGNVTESVKWYKKRFEMGGWKEEMYVSAYNICRMTGEKEWAWKATEICPYRSEALVAYCTFCRLNNTWSQELFALASHAASIPKPVEDCLFVEGDVYTWRALDELAIIAAFTGHKEDCKKTCVRLLHENTFPPDQKGRIENNLKACL